jgi:hypothetical protein
MGGGCYEGATCERCKNCETELSCRHTQSWEDEEDEVERIGRGGIRERKYEEEGGEKKREKRREWRGRGGIRKGKYEEEEGERKKKKRI